MSSTPRPIATGSKRPACLLLAGVLLCAGIGGAQTPQAQRFSVSQARQIAADPVTLRVYLDILTAAGQPVASVDAGSLRATLGSFSTDVDEPRRFADLDEGTGYVFLVDVSRSLRPDEYREMLAAIDAWMADLGPSDRVALIAFGSSSRTLVDWTDDFATAREALSGLGPTDDLTLLNQALADALALGERRDEGLPARRAIVVLSDGRDEGSGLALEDVLAFIRSSPTPIYTIGFAPPQRRNRERDLDVLRRLATNSGGSFHEAERTELIAAYERIEEAVARVWTVDLRCDLCPADGSEYRLQIDLSVDGRVLANGTELRILPRVGSAPQEPVVTEEPEPAPRRVPLAEPVDGPDAAREPARSRAAGSGDEGGSWFVSSRNILYFWLPLLLGLALLVAGIRRSGGGSATHERADDDPSIGDWPLGAEDLYAGEGREPVGGGADDAAARESGSSSFSLSLPEPGRLERDATPTAFPSAPPSGPAAEPPARSFGHAAMQSTQQTGHGERAEPRSGASPLPSLRPGEAERELEDALPVGRSVYKVAPRVVRLVVLRGTNKGQQFRALVRERLVVGVRSTADLVLTGEEGVAPEQFALSQDGDDLLIENLSTDRPTLVNGLELEGPQPVRAGDMVGNGNVILRVMLGD